MSGWKPVTEHVNLTRFVMPVFGIIVVALWIGMPAPVLRELTPWVGGGALLCIAVILHRVTNQIRHFAARHAAHWGGQENQLMRRMERSLFKMITVLMATVIVSAVFYYLAAVSVAGKAEVMELRIFWMLTIGGLAVTIYFGELVSRLLVLIDESLERIVQAGSQIPDD